MKPTRKFLTSFLYLVVSAQFLHGAADITISNGFNSDITVGSPFMDATDNGGSSNLNVSTLTVALSGGPVVVNTTTTTTSVFTPNGGRITVLDSIASSSASNLTLSASSDVLVGATIANTGGGSLLINANGAGGVQFNSDLVLTGGTSALTVVSSGAVTDALSTAIQVEGLATINAGTNAITFGDSPTDTVNFGSLSLTGGAVTISENSATVLQSVSASTLNLTSAGSITDSGNVSTTGQATLNGTSIVLGGAGETTSFGSLNFNSTGAVDISLDANTSITGSNSGFSVTLGTSGISSFASGATLNTASLNNASGNLTLSGNNLVNTMAVVNSGTLTVNGADTINTYQQDGTGVLAGSAALTVSSATLNGGSVSGNLQGNTTSTGTVGVTGIIGGGTLGVTGGVLTLSGAGQISSSPITISSGAGLVDSNGGLNNSSDVSNSGTLTVNSNDVINAYVQSSTGTLAGSATLTANGGATLNGGTITGNLAGNTITTANVIVDGSVGTGTLSINAGTLTLNGTSTNAVVNVAAGATLLDTAGGLLATGTVNNDGTVTINSADTIADYNQNGVGILNGTSTLNVSNVATLNGGTVAGSLSGNTVSTGTVAITGTIAGSNLSVTSGILSLNGTGQANSTNINVSSGAVITNNSGGLGNSSIIVNAGTLTMNANDTAGTYTQNGVNGLLQGGSTLTVTSANLNGGTVSGNLLGNTTSGGNVTVTGTVGGGSFTVASGVLSLNGTGSITSSPVEIQDVGELINASSGLAATANVINAGFLTMNSADTVATYVQNDSGELRGTHALTTTGGATLNGGTVTSNLIGNTTSTGVVLINGGLSGGSLSVTGGVLTLVGTATNTPVTISTGAVLIDQNAGLAPSAAVSNSGTLTINANETVDTYSQSAALSVLNGTHTLTATNGATLNGGTIVGKLLGNTTSTGTVLVSGSIGGGFLSVTGGTLTLTGTSTNNPVGISAGATLVDQNAGLISTADVTNAGTFTVNTDELINTYTQNGSGLLNGTAVLTATNGATLNGGEVAGSLLANIISTGTVTVSGSIGGGTLGVTGGVLTLTGTSTNTPINISSGAGLIDSNGGLASNAVVTNAGTLTVNAADTINTYTQNGTGTLAGTGVLTATNGATLNGGTVSGNLLGNTTSTGTVLVSGTIGGGLLNVTGGVLTLTGSSTNTPIDISSGAELVDSNGGLANAAVVTNAGTLTVNAADTINTYTQNGTGTLAGTGTLTAANGATLNGGTVSGNLLGNTTSTANVLVSGSIGGGFLNITGGTLNLTGTSTNTPIDISSGARLIDANGGLAPTAVVINAGTLTVNGNDTINTYTQNGSGLLDGSAILTASNGATLNGGTVSGNLRGNTISTGTVLVSGTIGGGSLGVTGGTLTLTGTSTNTPVNISTGATLIDSNGGLDSAAVVINAGTLTVNADDSVNTYTQNGASSLLNGSAILTALNGATLNAGTVAGNLLGNTTSTGNVLVSGTIGGGFLNVTGGVLNLTGTSTNTPIDISSGAQLIDANGGLAAAAVVINAGTLSVNADDTINTYTQNGSGLLEGPGILTTTSSTLNGGTVTGNLRGNTTSTGNVLVSGTIGGGLLNVTGGTLNLTGTSTNTPINISSGARLIDANGGLDSAAVVTSAGTLTVNGNDSINTYTQNGSGLLDGTAILTALNGATLNGGTVSGNLRGNTISTGTVLVSGTIGGGSLGVTGGTLTLTGTSTNTPVDISSGATLIDSNGGLDAAAVVTNAGTLTVNADDSVSNYTQNGSGLLNGSAILTALNGATLNGGTVAGNLRGNTISTGTVLVSGTIGGGSLGVTGGTLTLTGTSTNTPIDISSGATLVDSNGGLDAAADVTNAGTFTVNANDIINTYTQNGSGLLNGSAILTAANGATLNGGTVAGNLRGNTLSTGTVLVSGTIGGGSLGVTGGTLTLTGTSTNTPVDIFAGARLIDSNGGLDAAAVVINAGRLTVNADDSINTYTQNGMGLLDGSAILTAANGATLNGGTVSGNLRGNTLSTGTVLVSGTIGGGSLGVTGGTLTLSGTSTNTPVDISAGAALIDSNGGLDASAVVTNAGLLTVNANDTINTYTQNGNGELSGPASLTASNGATLNGGTVSGNLLGNTLSTGTVLVSGSVGGGTVGITAGTLTLTGVINSNPVVSPGATLKGTGQVNGSVTNQGTVSVGTMGEDLTITGALNTTGTIRLDLQNQSIFEKLRVGSISYGGDLVVTNTGSGLAVGQMARIIEAGSYSGIFNSLDASTFTNGVLYNDFTGTLIGLGGGEIISDGGYLNLNNNQTEIYLSLFDDSVQPGTTNVTRVLTPAGDYAVNFVSGISNGDAQLVRALNEATFSVPGSVNMNTINRLSPESHHGMADYAEEALHSHVRQAIEAPTLARNGNTQLFASLHSTTAGVDDDITKAGYDIDSAGATLGMRHDMTEQFQAGFLLGLDSGSISGSHIDTDAEGFAFGAFARIVADEKSKTIVTGSASFGNYSYDATRSSFEGDVEADGIGASAVELSLGVSTVIYEKENVTLSPNATLRYVNGSVDGFDEEGTGVELVVGSQDISSVIIDLGLDASIKLDEKVTFNGRVGYMHELSSSEEPITASFAATGANAVPFTVNAPGIDHQAFVLGLGLSFDLNDSATLGLSYRGEYRFDSQASQNVGLGVSFGF